MCLLVNKEEAIITAKENIFCYKQLSAFGFSQPQKFKYELGKLNKHVIINKKQADSRDVRIGNANYGETLVEEGYHSRNDSSIKDKTHLFMIPKGTKYITGGENSSDRDNYVSETIIYLGRNNWINRLIAKIKYKNYKLKPTN